MAYDLSRDTALAACRFRARRDLNWTMAHSAQVSPDQVRPACRAGRVPEPSSALPLSPTAQPSTCSRWIAFDPITRRSFRFGFEDHWIIEQLTGQMTLAEIQLQFSKRFPGVELSLQGLVDFCMGLTKIGLARKLEPQRACAPGRPALPSLANLIVWQIRGINADALLGRIAPHSSWLFSAMAVRLWLLFAMLAACLVLLEFNRLAFQAKSWDWLIQPTNWGVLLVVFLATRGLHELGHALACKRFGVRCPDIGLLVILGAPCVYCDVSESWRLPSLWQRAAIAAAGMYIELIVASLAALVWIATVDGPANCVALQTMFVCSISTIVINANPLMRFDGYYILSDLLDESNLRWRADGALWRLMVRWVVGPRAASQWPVVLPSHRRRFLVAFSLAGWIYRLSIAFVMAATLVVIYDGWQLVWFGRLLAVSLLVSWWLIPMIQLGKNLWVIASRSGGTLRLGFFSAVLVISVSVIPLPYRQFSSGWIQPKEMHGLYAPSSGQLARISARDGERVASQAEIFELRDHQSQLISLISAGQAERAQLALVAKKRDRYYQKAAAADLSAIETAADSARLQAEHAARRVASLRIKAPVDGSFMAMAAAPPDAAGAVPAEFVPRNWVDATQLGRWVSKGTMLGAVCSDSHVAVLPLTDKQLAWICSGSEVRLSPPNLPEKVFHCTVQSVVQLQEIDSTWRLMSALPAANQHPSPLLEKAHSAVPSADRDSTGGYAAIVELPLNPGTLPGSRIDAAFVAPSQTLLQLAVRWSHENFRWLAD